MEGGPARDEAGFALEAGAAFLVGKPKDPPALTREPCRDTGNPMPMTPSDVDHRTHLRLL
jgi:hypothetical protein